MIKSPYDLLQEIYNEDPWKILICCIMLNCTSRKQVDQIRKKFFKRWPSAEFLVKYAKEDDLSEMLAPLGFRNKRAKTIIRFSKEFIQGDWEEPIELYGIGKYGQDSWEIFKKNNLDVEPNDGVLNIYLDWRKKN